MADCNINGLDQIICQGQKHYLFLPKNTFQTKPQNSFFYFLIRLNLFNNLVKVLIISIQQYKKYKTDLLISNILIQSA